MTTRVSRHDVVLLSVVLLIQIALGTALRLVRLPVLSRGIARGRTLARRLVTAPEERLAWAIEGVGRRLPWLSTCLVRALAADLLLGGADCTGHVKIGVRRSPSGALESHAWFERDGRIVVGGDGALNYVDFVTLGTAMAERT